MDAGSRVLIAESFFSKKEQLSQRIAAPGFFNRRKSIAFAYEMALVTSSAASLSSTAEVTFKSLLSMISFASSALVP